MTGSETNHVIKTGGGNATWRFARRPFVWAVLTVGLSAAAYLYQWGPDQPFQALSVSAAALAAFACLAWTLGVSRAAPPASRLLHAAAESSRDGLLITTPDGRFVYVNPAFHRLFHLAPEAASLDASTGAWQDDGAQA